LGSEGVIAAVADAGPLIHLGEIGRLSLLSMFEAVHVPVAVWAESVQPGRLRETDLLAIDTVHRHTLLPIEVARFASDNGFLHLHVGEMECLYLCRELDVPLLLTDDLAVREIAKRLSVTPVGSLGVVVKAYHLGHLLLPEAEQLLVDLHDVSSLFVSRTLVDLAIEQLQRTSGNISR
jgi:predicted nucleic acid-binding protein